MAKKKKGVKKSDSPLPWDLKAQYARAALARAGYSKEDIEKIIIESFGARPDDPQK